jgi:flagellar basal-body rod modification protein FlgD
MSVSSAMPASVVSQTSTDQVPTSSTGVSNANSNLNENNFLTLMTTQLENQDPLNPMSSSDFAAELAQFSTADGVQNLQTTLTGIGTQLTTASGVQASNLVGQSVAVSGSTLVLGATGGTAGALSLPSAASDVVVTVADASGNVVNTLNLGALPAGTQSFSWNGQDSTGDAEDPGIYQFAVSAVSSTGASITATPLAVAPVTSVTMGGTNGPMLDLGNGYAPVALSAVQQVF